MVSVAALLEIEQLNQICAILGDPLLDGLSPPPFRVEWRHVRRADRSRIVTKALWLDIYTAAFRNGQTTGDFPAYFYAEVGELYRIAMGAFDETRAYIQRCRSGLRPSR
ncbi:hypothetical protein JCM10908_000623 [Rhodotorula pacifica]|uniref:uncharacterized protein n=1 Tax=Rhodotorula pacifica TaxID=1495444 RepID=UPI0031748C9F